MKPVTLALFALLAAFTVAADSEEGSESGTRFRAMMVGIQEVPALFTQGRAVFTARVIENDTAIQFEVTYTDLSGPPAAAHVHLGQRGVSGGVSFFLCGGGGQAACPATTSASFSGTVTAANVVGPAAQGIAAGDLAAILKMMRAGVTYANIHTAKHPPGEIRGQLRVVGGSDSSSD
jgi:CHRD domain